MSHNVPLLTIIALCYQWNTFSFYYNDDGLEKVCRRIVS